MSVTLCYIYTYIYVSYVFCDFYPMYISLTEARGLGSHCAVGGRLRRQRSYGWGLVAIDRGGGLREPGGSSTGLAC